MKINAPKMTSQREIILKYLRENYTHPSVEEVFLHAKEKLPRISKKTVYNNLRFLCDKGYICEVKAKGVLRYEPAQEPHSHMICRKCGRINDFESGKIFTQIKKSISRKKDFIAESISITLYGICNNCRGGK